MRMPYRKMYEALQSNHGKQMALCQKVLHESTELYSTILASERANILQGNSAEHQGINRLMCVLVELHDCMVNTDIAVDEAVTK